jgi:hypothetical protein
VKRDILILSGDAAITAATVFRTKRLAGLHTKEVVGSKFQTYRCTTYHALDTKCLAIEASFRCQILDDLYPSGKSEAEIWQKTLTVLSSPSLVGLGQVPGSKVMARKKLYAQTPNNRVNIRCVMACDWVSTHSWLERRHCKRCGTYDGQVVLPNNTLSRSWTL